MNDPSLRSLLAEGMYATALVVYASSPELHSPLATRRANVAASTMRDLICVTENCAYLRSHISLPDYIAFQDAILSVEREKTARTMRRFAEALP